MPVDLRELGLQPLDDLGDVGVAIVARPQRDREPAAVRRRVRAVGADDDDTRRDVGIAQQRRRRARCWSSIIVANETSGAASVTPMMSPVSSTGKKPFGTWSASTTVIASVASVTSSVVRWWRSTTLSVRS